MPESKIIIPNGGMPGDPSGEHIVAEFEMQQQVMTLWCWAAVASSISRLYDGEGFHTQQNIVAKVLDKPYCDVSGNLPVNCNSTASLEDALNEINHLQQPVLDVPIDSNMIKQQILNNHPIGVQLSYGSGDTHFVVIYGYTDFGSQLWLNIADPQASFENPGSKTVLYESLLSFSNGSWSRTYLTV